MNFIEENYFNLQMLSQDLRSSNKTFFETFGTFNFRNETSGLPNQAICSFNHI